MPGAQPMLKNLAPRYYAEAGIYQDERQAIFRRHWQMLGPAAQVAERYVSTLTHERADGP